MRIPANATASKSHPVGPPISTGAPVGNARQSPVGSCTGKLQVIAFDPVRPALDPANQTVSLPDATVPSLVGMSIGAKATPGGVGRCGAP